MNHQSDCELMPREIIPVVSELNEKYLLEPRVLNDRHVQHWELKADGLYLTSCVDGEFSQEQKYYPMGQAQFWVPITPSVPDGPTRLVVHIVA